MEVLAMECFNWSIFYGSCVYFISMVPILYII